MVMQEAKAIILQSRPTTGQSPYRKQPKPYCPPWQQQQRQQNSPPPRCTVQEHVIDSIIAYLHDLCEGSPPPENSSVQQFDGATADHEGFDHSNDQPFLVHLTKKKPPAQKPIPPGNIKRLLSSIVNNKSGTRFIPSCQYS